MIKAPELKNIPNIELVMIKKTKKHNTINMNRNRNHLSFFCKIQLIKLAWSQEGKYYVQSKV